MKPSDESGNPPNVIRWAIIGCIVWILSGVTLIYTTYSSIRRPLDVGGTLCAAAKRSARHGTGFDRLRPVASRPRTGRAVFRGRWSLGR